LVKIYAAGGGKMGEFGARGREKGLGGSVTVDW